MCKKLKIPYESIFTKNKLNVLWVRYALRGKVRKSIIFSGPFVHQAHVVSCEKYFTFFELKGLG
jgi:hypothetical protein